MVEGVNGQGADFLSVAVTGRNKAMTEDLLATVKSLKRIAMKNGQCISIQRVKHYSEKP